MTNMIDLKKSLIGAQDEQKSGKLPHPEIKKKEKSEEPKDTLVMPKCSNCGSPDHSSAACIKPKKPR